MFTMTYGAEIQRSRLYGFAQLFKKMGDILTSGELVTEGHDDLPPCTGNTPDRHMTATPLSRPSHLTGPLHFNNTDQKD